MSENNRKSQRFLLQLGAAFAVTASLPLSSVVADAATSADKLSALRAAASSGHIELMLSGGAPATERLERVVGFDNGAPETPPQTPEPAPEPAPDPGK